MTATERNSEFEAFMNAPEITPPSALSSRVRGHIHADLSPSFPRVFFKLTWIQAAMGALSLLACPQFGVAPLQNHGLMAVYMSLGPLGCMAACGATFIAGGAILAALLFRPEELRAIRRWRLAHFSLVGVTAALLLSLMGAPSQLSEVAAWLAGVVVTGSTLIEASRIRALSR